MTKRGNILVVDDNRAIRTSLSLLLSIHFNRVTLISTPNEINRVLREEPDLDVVLLDMNFHSGINSGNEGIFWLREIRRMRPLISVVLFTAYADIKLAVTAIKDGAVDFVEKPWDNDKLIVTLRNAVELAQTNQKIKNLKSLKNSAPSQMFWGSSSAMQELRTLTEKVAPTDANILITGENGTGKEVLAHQIHALSLRSPEVFVGVDMGALTESLFESELFGHAKGAFTDAKTEKIGKFEAASAGTIFLDEIGNLPLHLQSKLLTVLQSRSVVRVGENTPRPIDIRLISATNAPIELLAHRGEFREDLLYRLNTIVLHLPSLRERGKEDIAELATMFLVRYAKKYNKPCDRLSPDALLKLQTHLWPGNIHELQHVIEKAVIICEGEIVSPEDLLLTKQKTIETPANNSGTIEQMERSMIQNALNESGENLSEVAQRLGITRQTLYNKIKKYQL